MSQVGKIRKGPRGLGLENRRPPVHLRGVDAKEDRKKRLGYLARRERKARGIGNQAQLAEAMGFEIGEATIQSIEAGRRVVSEASYHALENFYGLPLGTMQRVLAGEIDEFPAAEGAETTTDSDEPQFEVGGKVFTEAEIRVLAKALGPKGLYEWAMKASTSGDASASDIA